MISVPIHGVRTVETYWVPMSDGRRLAARLFLPDDAERRPVPLILEYIPYRRRDGTRSRDDRMHRWLAAQGFACARVDVAGTGDSDGIMEDEYVAREQDDAVEVIGHLCAQAWCTGVAGMMGISWGGFSALQAAARRPARLKAIVTACSTDDRFACDAHYSGGCLINDNFGWGGALFSYAAMPPDPAVVGEDRWRDLWRQRIEAHSLYPGTWLRHQRRDAFWRHGSVCEDWAAIDCAVLAVGGWLDGYAQTILRLVENLPGRALGRVKGLCGPWGHQWPQNGVPGPQIGFLQECARFFGRWLKDEPNGAEADPDMRLFLMDAAPAATHHAERPGRWLGFQAWPPLPGEVVQRRLHLGAGTLGDEPSAMRPQTILSPLTTGLRGQEWCPYGQGRVAAESATDQREDDAGSLCFDTPPLAEDIAIVGEARLRLRIAADHPQAQVAARLTDVAPDGTSSLVTFALLNLSHRSGSQEPAPMAPGEFETVEVVLKPVGQPVPAGHRLRLALSSSYWPMAWPSPEAATLIVDPTASVLDLPLLCDETTLQPVSFAEAVRAEGGPVTVVVPARQSRRIETDVPTERTTLTALSDDGRSVIEEIATGVASWRRKEYAISRGDPSSCSATVTCHEERERPGWHPRVETVVTATADARNFRVQGWLKAYDGDTLFAERHYDDIIPRDHM